MGVLIQRISIVIFCLLIFSLPANSAEVYVYVSAATGSDTPASGGLVNPYASIGYAISQNPGTVSDPVTIRVAAGTYYENIVLSGYQSLNGGYNADFSVRDAVAWDSPLFGTTIDGGYTDRVISLQGSESTSREISGFSIRNGNASGSGGGIDGNFGEAAIRYNKIFGNYADGHGGGLYQCYGTKEWNYIYDNTATSDGGGIQNCWGDMSNCYIYDNYAVGNGGGISSCSNGTMSDCEIYDNTAVFNGGGLATCSFTMINDCSIYDNTAGSDGGGIYSCSSAINSCTIYNNSAQGNGGGVNFCSGYIINTIVYLNEAGLNGGGLYNCDGDLLNNTVYGNDAGNLGGGMSDCNSTIANCILWANTSGFGYSQGYSNVVPWNCCLQDWPGGGIDNISTDPDFVLPSLGQFHLMAGSDCIDSGANTGVGYDIDGEARPAGSTHDIGADEWTGADSSAPVFDHFLRSVPREDAVYLEWDEATDPGMPISYFLFGSLTSGGHTFTVPVGLTLGNFHELVLPNGDVPHYVVPRAEDCYGNQTSNTDEYIFYPEPNMITGILYNSAFEYTPLKRDTGAAPPTPPPAWGASSQDYGDKTTYFYHTSTDPYEGSWCARIETFGTPVNPDDLSIASLVAENSIALEKDHTYAVSAAVRRSDSQWARFILFSSGFSIIHTESIDALDDQFGDTGWEILYFHFRAPSNINAYVRIDSLVTNKRTAGAGTCIMWVDDVQIVDLGIETYTDIYNVTPPPPQYGIRNRYFDLGTETETSTIGVTAYTSTNMPKRWNMSMAVDTGSNNASGYPVWGQETPSGLADTTGAAGFVKARGADTSDPAWPAMSADGVNINVDENNGQRHVLTFNYGAVGATKPLLRVFMINNDFSHYSSLFIDPSVGIPGNRMWPLSMHYTPGFGDSLVLVRFDNVTLGAGGGGPHTDEATMYIDNVKVSKVD